MKECRVIWNCEENSYTIRLWSDSKSCWLVTKEYYVIEYEGDPVFGVVSERLIMDLNDLQEKGYKIVFCL